MIQRIVPKKLELGDTVRIVAPARSIGVLSENTKNTANLHFAEMGLKLTFGKHVDEMNDFASSSIKSRVEDLHDAFGDKKVKAIITVIGGFNSNQLLSYLDWKLISANPKILCGYSDITALNNAIYAKTGLVNYSGPHYSTFGQRDHLEYTTDYFKKCLFSDKSFEIKTSPYWLDDEWWKLEKRITEKNEGWLVINEGQATGTLLGANLCTFNLLQGTEFFPGINDSVLFLEDDSESSVHLFDRDLQSVIHQPGFEKVRGIVIGRFQKASKIDNKLLIEIVKTKEELDKLPVIANVDFGHTEPKITFPIGGTVEILAKKEEPAIRIVEH